MSSRSGSHGSRVWEPVPEPQGLSGSGFPPLEGEPGTAPHREPREGVNVPRGTEGSVPRTLARLWKPERPGPVKLEGLMTLAGGDQVRVALLPVTHKRRPGSPDYVLVAASDPEEVR